MVSAAAPPLLSVAVGETAAEKPTAPPLPEIVETDTAADTKDFSPEPEPTQAFAQAELSEREEKSGAFSAVAAIVVVLGGGAAVTAGLCAATGTVWTERARGLLRTLKKLLLRS